MTCEGKAGKYTTRKATESADKVSDTVRNLLSNGAILVRNEDGFARLYVLPENAADLQAALTKDCYPGSDHKVPSAGVYLTNPITHDTTLFTRLEIPDLNAAMIANGVERTVNGERRGIVNVAVLQAKQSGPEGDIDLAPKAFELLADGKMVGQATARQTRASGNSQGVALS